MGNGYLFNTFILDDYLNKQKQNMLSRISREDKAYLASINIDEYLTYLQNSYEISLPIIDESNIYIDKKEQMVERYDHFDCILRKVDGIVINVFIPFQGDANLFLARANTWSSRLPMGNVVNNCIVVTIGLTMQEISEYNLTEAISNTISDIQQYLSYAEKQINEFNENIKIVAKSEITYLVDNYKKVNKFFENVPYTLKTNDKIPSTFKVPNIVRKAEIKKPVAKTKNLIPEPELCFHEYNHIIQICSDMTKVIERSPNSFVNMDEESLRTHFLVQLNGHYQGQATGETFNSKGKTDILVRSDNQNVFIAECKFWRGKKAYLSTIDQLLGYVTYRDTKTAIFVFVKNNEFTKIFEQMKAVISEHPNFIKFITSYIPPVNTSAFRCEFMNANDCDKHFYITVMAFFIPSL